MSQFTDMTSARNILWIGIFFSLAIAIMPFLLRTLGSNLFYVLQAWQYTPWLFWIFLLSKLVASKSDFKMNEKTNILLLTPLLCLLVCLVCQFIIALNVYMVINGSSAVSPAFAVLVISIGIISALLFSVGATFQISMLLKGRSKIFRCVALLFAPTGFPPLAYLFAAMIGATSDSAVWVWYGAQSFGCLMLYVFLALLKNKSPTKTEPP